MIERRPINPERVRKITGSFSFIEHRFLRDGFFQGLSQYDLLLYFFLILVGTARDSPITATIRSVCS